MDNSFPASKVALRLWLADQFSSLRVLDVYGGYGLMHRQVWQRRASVYGATDGDALAWLEAQKTLDHDIFDVDPYGSPFEALKLISPRATCDTIGIVCTDGGLRRQAMFRGRLPRVVLEATGWDKTSRTLKAGLYHQYSAFLRHLLARVMPEFEVHALAVKFGQGVGKCGTAYFAAVMKRISTGPA